MKTSSDDIQLGRSQGDMYITIQVFSIRDGNLFRQYLRSYGVLRIEKLKSKGYRADSLTIKLALPR